MSLPYHRLPPPVSQTVGGAAAAANRPRTGRLSETSSVFGDRCIQARVPRHPGPSTANDVNAERSVSGNRPPQPPSKQDSASTARTNTVATDTKRPGTDIPRPMRPQSVLNTHMKYLTQYEHQEIFEYPQVERHRNSSFNVFLHVPVIATRPRAKKYYWPP